MVDPEKAQLPLVAKLSRLSLRARRRGNGRGEGQLQSQSQLLCLVPSDMLQLICGEVTQEGADDEQSGAPTLCLNLSETCTQVRALFAPQLARLKTSRERLLLASVRQMRFDLRRLARADFSALDPPLSIHACSCLALWLRPGGLMARCRELKLSPEQHKALPLAALRGTRSWVSRGSSAKALVLRASGLTGEGAVIAAELIKWNLSLRQLHLEYNSIGDQGALAISRALKVNAVLISLNLYYCSIGNHGMVAIAEALKWNFALTSLNLERNAMQESGAAAIADSLRTNMVLTHLNLSDQCFYKDGRLQSGIGDLGAAAIAAAIEVNTSLSTLELRANPIRNAGAAAIAEALKGNSVVTKLDLRDHAAWDPRTEEELRAVAVARSSLDVLL